MSRPERSPGRTSVHPLDLYQEQVRKWVIGRDESVFAFVLFRDALKMLFKQILEVTDTAWPVHPLGDRCDRKE